MRRRARVRPDPGGLTSPGGLRDWVHRNPGMHLDGGLSDDLAWQLWWLDLALMPLRRYDAPSGKVGRRFVRILGAEMQGVRDRRGSSEPFIFFQTVILKRARHVTTSHAIRRRIENRLDAWGAGKHAMLVGDTLSSCEEYPTAARKEETAEYRSQTYHSLVLHGKLRSAVRWITKRETGGVLQPGDSCEKTGDGVLEVFRAKHPEVRTLTVVCLTSYTGCPPELTPVDITDNTVTAVAGRLLGGAGT